jgi:hypothetical protein
MNARADSFTLAMAASAPPTSVRGAPARDRRAALLLHTVSAADRSWLLAQLSPAERGALEPLLAELRELGIPADRDMLDELGDVSSAAPVPLATPAPRGLFAADGRIVAQVLAAEPVDLVARLLACKAWPWREAVLSAQGPNRREQLRDRLAALHRSDDSAPLGLLDLRLIELVEARVTAAALRVPDGLDAEPRLAHTRPARASAFGWMGRWLAGSARPGSTT